ncbi:MraZ N-terminal domain containing protein [bacterium]|nr:MAG: MraZ N-terminal domain containing protein [bacterium]
MDYFERKLDDKNRLTIPAELRHEFEAGNVIITRGFANYLHLYTEKLGMRQWNRRSKAIYSTSVRPI